MRSKDRDPQLKIQKKDTEKQDLKKQNPKISSKGRDPKLKIQKNKSKQNKIYKTRTKNTIQRSRSTTQDPTKERQTKTIS